MRYRLAFEVLRLQLHPLARVTCAKKPGSDRQPFLGGDLAALLGDDGIDQHLGAAAFLVADDQQA